MSGDVYLVFRVSTRWETLVGAGETFEAAEAVANRNAYTVSGRNGPGLIWRETKNPNKWESYGYVIRRVEVERD